MDQKAHWNKIASSYDDEVFDVFKNDRNGILASYFKKHANKEAAATDFGCGTGKAFEYLSPGFSEVLAVDISDECLEFAKARGYENITYKRADLTRQNVVLREAAFGLCCNVAILPDLAGNRAILKTVFRGLSKKGSALFVVPSIESMLFASWRLIDWYRREGVKPEKVPQDELNYYDVATTDIIQGIIKINGVPTKHYSENELKVLFNEAGLSITAIEKLEYDWSTEFDSPPRWLKDPYPWDWMIECQK